MAARSRRSEVLASILLAMVLSGPTPVALPGTEDPADWEAPLAMAGLQVGEPGTGAWVGLEASAGSWLLRVRDRDGVLHEVRIEPPSSAQEREDVVWLAASLLHPATPAADEPLPRPVREGGESSGVRPPPAPAEPPRDAEPALEAWQEPAQPEPPPRELSPSSDLSAPPAEPPAVIEPEPRPREPDPTPPPPREPVPAAVEPAFVPDAEPSAARTSPRASAGQRSALAPWTADRPRWFVAVGAGIDGVIGATPTASLGVDLGIDVRGFLRIGASGAIVSPSVLLFPDGARFMLGGDVFPLMVWSTPTPRKRAIWIGAGVGMRFFGYRGDLGPGTPADPFIGWIDDALGESGVTVALSPGDDASPGTDVAFAGRVEVQGALRLAEWLVLVPWFQVQAIALGGERAAPGRPDLLFPLAFRGGFGLVGMPHVGRGLPPAGGPG